MLGGHRAFITAGPDAPISAPPSVLTPSSPTQCPLKAAPLRSNVGYSVSGGVAIYGPFDAGFVNVSKRGGALF